MTVSLLNSTLNSNNITTYRNEINSQKSVSNKNISSMDNKNKEKFEAQQAQIVSQFSSSVNFFIQATRNNDDSKDKAFEEVKISTKDALNDLKALISEENIVKTNEVEKDIEEKEKDSKTDIKENGQVEFGKFLNRAQGIVNNYANYFTKTTNEDSTQNKTKTSDKNFFASETIKEELSSLFNIEEVTSKNDIDSEKNEYTEVVDKFADKLMNTLASKAQNA